MEDNDLPSELSAKPLALVGLSGLDTLNNAVHKTIWESFNNRRVERAPILFKLFDNAHEFPVIKPKRNSYEWYIPKGILKRNWMNKHLCQIPAVIVIFYDLDWNDTLWNEKLIECSSRVQSIRAALEGRDTRLTVVLIQNTTPLPAGEDQVAVERAASLCSSCELNAKALFVLPHGDHLQGYTVRLENAFYDLAQNYYHHEARNIKLHREHLIKTTHQYLFVRHQFKMGFLNELKQDNHTAHKHYTYAYNNLLELRVVDTNALEIRTVAGFINYKLCRLMFALSLPRDAISQFRAHIERFRNRVGFQELAFEHHAWISRQLCIFGDIFDEAVKLGLPAVQTQHPGIYYHQAAQAAMLRRSSAIALCSGVTDYPVPDPLEGKDKLEFYGQRPWRPGKLSAEPPDPAKEQSGIQALQFIEKKVNNSQIIISLFGHAISQYKTYKCPRMRRHLVVQMAEEYYNVADYGKVLTLLSHMLWDYRTEYWPSLLADILQRALNCSFLTASIQDYVLLSLEILSSSIAISADSKTRIYDNLNKILRCMNPEPEPDLKAEDVQKANQLWTHLLSERPKCVSIDLSNIVSCIEVKARFTKSRHQADQNVSVELFIRSTCPHALNLSRVSVTINTPDQSSEFALNDATYNLKSAAAAAANPTLLFDSNQAKRFLIEFMPKATDIGKEIQIGGINLQLGTVTDCYVDLRFNGLGNAAIAHICPELLHFKRDAAAVAVGDYVPLGSAQIIARDSKLRVAIRHLQPALVGEWYEIVVEVVNEEDYSIKDVVFAVNLISDDGTEQRTEISTEANRRAEKLPLIINHASLNRNDTKILKLYMQTHSIGERNMSLNISYQLECESPITSVKELNIHVPVAKPFEINAAYLSTLFESVAKLYTGESFIVSPVINCISPWPIVIENSTLEFKSNVRSMDAKRKCQIANLELHNGETGSEMFLIVCDHPSILPITIGQYSIKWKRQNSDRISISQLSLIGLPVEWVPLQINVNLPAHGLVRTPVLITYALRNKSNQLIQLDVAMDASEAFMFAGYKKLQISILPEKSNILQYTLYPLLAGSVALPKINISVCNEMQDGLCLKQEQLRLLIERSLPTHLYVMPQVKGNPMYSPLAELVVQGAN